MFATVTFLSNFKFNILNLYELYIKILCISYIFIFSFTIYHIRLALEKKSEQLLKFLNKFVMITQDNYELQNVFALFLDFLQILHQSNSINYPSQHTISLSPSDLIIILSWNSKLFIETRDQHPLMQIKMKLEQLLMINIQNEEETVNEDSDTVIINDKKSSNILINEILIVLRKLLELLHENISIVKDWQEIPEPLFPHGEGIVAQYAGRPVYQLIDNVENVNMERLETSYWLGRPSPPRDQNNIEQITCDLSELMKTCLSTDTNIIADCKRLLHMSASPQTNRERTVAAPCFRTRRVEVEPSTGRPEKKIYGTFIKLKVNSFYLIF